MKNHIQLSVVKRLILSLTLLCFVFQAHAATITFALTNSLGQPDTNVIRGFPLVAYPNADGSWTTAGLPFRITPTNGIASINLAAGNYLLTNSTLVSPSYVNPSGFGTQQGVIIAVPAANGTYPFGLLAISGYNTYNYNGSTAFGNTNTSTVGQGTNVVIQTNSNSYTVQVPNQSFLTNGLPSKLDVTNIVNAITTNNPAGYISSAATNLIWAVLPQTNGFGNIVASNASSFVTPVSLIDATNKAYLAWLTALQATNTALKSQLQLGSTILTNISNTGAWTNSLVAGAGANISTNLGVVTVSVTFGTNGLATTNFVTNAISAAINSATNGFVSSNITNGLATTNYVDTATNGFVLSSITNGLATTNYVNIATNGHVLASITNGLATTNYVNTSTNTIGVQSGLMAFQQTNVWATFNYVTNSIIITSNVLSSVGGTASNAISNFNGRGTNTVLTNAISIYVTNMTIIGGIGNDANPPSTSSRAIVLGGSGNSIVNTPLYVTLIGGLNNTVSGNYSAIIGGAANTANGLHGFIAGGNGNLSQGTDEAIVGGNNNWISESGTSSGGASFIGAGFSNRITNSFYGFSEGANNFITNASYSVAMGNNSAISNGNSFVWCDGSVGAFGTLAPFWTTATNQFLIHATGGFGLNTNNPAGYSMNVNGSINATNMYVNGVAVATTSSAGSVGGLTNITVATNGTVYTVSVPTQAFLTNGFTTMVYSNPANIATVAYVNTVGLGATNLAYLVGQSATNLSYLIGQAGTNLFNQSGVSLTNISSTISNNLLNFVQITNGTAFYPTLKSNITLNYFPWLYTTTNVLGINGAGVVPANGTYLQIAVGTWTNIIGNGSDVIFQNPTYYLRTNLVNLYSTSNLFFNSTWVNVVGSTAVPTNSGFGYIANHNGQWDTNLWAQGLVGIVPMSSLDTTKVVTNNSNPNFNNTAVGNLTVNGFQTNNSSMYFISSINGGRFNGDGGGLTNLTVNNYVQGSLTNSETFILYTNNLAFVPGFGYTNWPSSTTAGIQEIMNMFRFKANPNPAGGVSIRLASIGTSNKPAFYPITTCINATNYFTLQGNGLGATVIEYKGASIGTTNDTIPAALMFYTPPLVSNGSSNALNYFEMHDLALVSDIDCPAAMIVTYANAFNISRCQFGSTNLLYQTNFVSSPAYVGSSSTAPRGLIGVYMQGPGNNQDAFYNCFFQDLADGIFADGVDWGIVQDCHFGSISMLNSSTFTNTWNTNVQFHVGSAIAMSNPGLGWVLRNIHSLNCNTLFYSPSSPNLACYDMEVESCNYYSMGCLPMTYAKILPSGTLAAWSDVNTFYQATGTQTSDVGNGYLIGMDGDDDLQFTIRDDTGRDLLKLPNAFEETETGTGGILGGGYMTWNNHGVFSFNGGGITNLNANAFAKSTANIPTNTAAILATSANNTNNFTTGTVYTAPNQRSTLSGSVFLSSAVGGSANILLAYTNNGQAAFLPMQKGSGIAIQDYEPFSIPLSPNATFSFISTMGSGASGYVTNAILWKQ